MSAAAACIGESSSCASEKIKTARKRTKNAEHKAKARRALKIATVAQKRRAN